MCIVSLKENRFTKCDQCTHYKEMLEVTTHKEERKKIENLHEQHIALVM